MRLSPDLLVSVFSGGGELVKRRELTWVEVERCLRPVPARARVQTVADRYKWNERASNGAVRGNGVRWKKRAHFE
jgi:hypothetical protein